MFFASEEHGKAFERPNTVLFSQNKKGPSFLQGNNTNRLTSYS